MKPKGRLYDESASGSHEPARGNGASRRLLALAISVRGWIQRRRAARAGLRALNRMSDRELNDLGLGRCEIERVSWEFPSVKRWYARETPAR